LAEESKRVSVKEWFGLKRDNFVLKPKENVEDRKFYASRPNSVNIQSQITGLEVRLESKLSPKRLYWGPYGSGKTHTLYKVLEALTALGLDIHVAFVECPALKKTSTFTELYNRAMNEIGMDFVISLLKDVMNATVKQVGFAEAEIVQRKIMEIMDDEDLGRATYSFVTAGPQFDPMVLWRWITASDISNAERDKLRVTSDLRAADPERLTNILITLGRLLREHKNKTLVLVFDELDRTKDIGSLDAQVTFSTAFTRLTDPAQDYVAAFLAASASRIQELPEIISAPVQNRLGKRDIVVIPSMTSEDVEPFIKDILDYLRDLNADVDKLVEQAKAETEEEIEKEFYPFTKEAIGEIKSACGQIITPRDITRFMSDAASYAKLRGKHVITKKDVASVSGT